MSDPANHPFLSQAPPPPPYSTQPRPGQKTLETSPYPAAGASAPPYHTSYQYSGTPGPYPQMAQQPPPPGAYYPTAGYPQGPPAGYPPMQPGYGPPPPGPQPGYYGPPQPYGQPTYVVQEHHHERRHSSNDTEKCCLFALCAACPRLLFHGCFRLRRTDDTLPPAAL